MGAYPAAERGLQELCLLDSGAWAQQLWCRSLIALRYVGSSQTGDGARIGRRILYH